MFELEQGRQELRDGDGPEPGALKLAVTTASTLPSILREYRLKRPRVQIHVEMLSIREMVARLHRGEVDYGLSSPPVREEDIECQVVFVDPVYVAVPEGHRLASRNSVSLTELREEWFVGVKKGYGIRDFVDSACASIGFSPKYVYEGDEPARLSHLVAAEIGIAFMPSTARNSREPIRYLQVEERELGLVREIALVWHKSRYLSPAAREFRDVVRRYFDTLPGANETQALTHPDE